LSVTILTARPADVADADQADHRRYRSHVERLALTAPTGEAMLEAGVITRHMVTELSLRARISRKQALRWLVEWKDVREHGEPEKANRVPPGLLQVIARKKGNVALAMRAYYDFDYEKIASVRSSVYRAIQAVDPHFLLALKAGEDRWERYLEIGVYEPDHANELWQMDEMHIPIRCRMANGQIIENLYLLSIVDAYSGLVLNAQVTVGQSDALMAGAVLARAIAGGTLKGVTYGGSAEALAMDNALIFTSKDIRDVLLLASIKPQYARPYTPPDKADVERYHWTLQQMYLMGVTGYLDAPVERRFVLTGEHDEHGRPKRARVEVPMGMPADDADLNTVEETTEITYAAIHQHNTEHVNSSTGQVAIERYGSSRKTVLLFGHAAFWDYALPYGKPQYIGERRGIHVAGGFRSSKEMGLINLLLVARELPGFDPLYLVGKASNKKFLSSVRPAKDETAEERIARLDRNHAATRRLRELVDVSSVTAADRAETPGTPAYVSEKRAEKLAATDPAPLASVDAALSVPELEEAG
jgi:hypothetical protein